jgi:pimeloyl-ACP methyl ester carboxylesterase
MDGRLVTIETGDRVTLVGRRWEPRRPAGSAVVLVHGFSGSKDDPGLVAVAEALRAAGHLVLAYDARGHGASGGLCTLGDLERHDVAAAVALARCDADRVVAVGASMGAIAVLRHAAEGPGPEGVVTVSAPARWRYPRNPRTALAWGLTRTRVGRLAARRFLHVRVSPRWDDPEPPVVLAARIGAPLAVVHGTADRFVPAREAEVLAAAAPRSRLQLVRGMGHAFHPAAGPAIVEAVGWVLGQAGTAAAASTSGSSAPASSHHQASPTSPGPVWATITELKGPT